MADVIDVPSIWDYLGGAIQKGAESYNKVKADQKDTEDQKVTFMNQLLQSGLINQEDYNTAIQGTRFKDIKARPSKTEQAEQIAATGKNPTTGKPATAVDYNRVGLLTPGEQKKDVLTGEQSNTGVNAEQIKQRYLSGEQISDREAAAIGVQTDENLRLAKIGAEHTMLKEKAPGYVHQALLQIAQQNGGRIPYRGWEDLIDQAADQYNQFLISQGQPADESAKAYMHSLVLEQLIEQRKQDIEQLKAQNVGMNRMSPVDRMFQSMTGVVETRRKILDDMLTNNYLLGLKLQNPNAQNDPDVIRYRAVEQSLLNAQNAQAKLAQGIVPSDASTYLQVDPTIAANTTGKQIVGPGAPGAQVRQNVVDQLVKRLKANPNLQSQLADGLKDGTITQGEYDAITAALAPPQSSQKDTTNSFLQK